MDRIALLVQRLHDTDQELETLLAGEVDSVTNATGRTMLLHRAQGHLRDSEYVRQSTVLNALPAYVALLDSSGATVITNDAWREFAKRSGSRSVGVKPLAGYVSLCEGASGYSHADAAAASAGVEGVLAGRLTDFAMEFSCDAPDQAYRFLLRVTPLPGHPPGGAVVMHLDITERQLAAEAFAALSERTTRRERMLSTMLSASLDLASLYDRDGRILFANQPLLDLWGLTLEQATGRASADLLQRDLPATARTEMADKLRAQILGVVATGQSVSDEVTTGTCGGVEANYEYLYSPVLAPDGSVDFVVGNTRVTTERKRAEGAVRRQNSELRALLNLMPAKVWFKDTSNHLLRVNEQVAADAGLQVHDMEGKHASASYGQLAHAQHEADLVVIASKMPRLGEVREGRDASGHARWYQVDKVPYCDESGAVIGLVVLEQDITAHKHDQEALRDLNTSLEMRVDLRTREADVAREEAEHANRAKSRFLATVSHEIRTPMNGLLGLLELLSLGALDAEQMSTLQAARHSGDGLLRIIDDVLDFAKIEADRLELSNAVGSVRQAVDATCRLHRQSASSRNLSLTCQFEEGIEAWHLFDELRLCQILSNFLSNAIKFTEAGRIDLSVSLEPSTQAVQHLRFTVTDTGLGVSAEQMERLFLPFGQAEVSTSSRFGGTGLGLVICRRLAHLMGGTIDMDSTPGEGTRMSLRVPLAVATADAPALATDQGAPRELEFLLASRRAAPSRVEAERDGTLVLLVDDHPVNRMMLLRQLAALGYCADAFEDGLAAFDAWKAVAYGAVLTDCNMPLMSGYALASAIRAQEAATGRPRVPIVGCTANALASAASDCLAAGMDGVLIKPAGLTALAGMVDSWFPLPVRMDADLSRASASALASTDTLGYLDLELLDGFCGGDLHVRAQICASYCTASRADAIRLRAAWTSGDGPGVVHHAHRIKGASLMLGATCLAAVCDELEALGLRPQMVPDDVAWRRAMRGFEEELQRQFAQIDMLHAAGAPPQL